MQKTKTVQKEKKPVVKIDGLEDFPLKTVGLTEDSIEKSGGHIKIPLELIPFIKICRTPAVTRKKRAKIQHKYLLRAKRKSKKHPRKGRQKA